MKTREIIIAIYSAIQKIIYNNWFANNGRIYPESLFQMSYEVVVSVDHLFFYLSAFLFRIFLFLFTNPGRYPHILLIIAILKESILAFWSKLAINVMIIWFWKQDLLVLCVFFPVTFYFLVYSTTWCSWIIINQWYWVQIGTNIILFQVFWTWISWFLICFREIEIPVTISPLIMIVSWAI